jgi:hypothetical protein
MFYMPLILHLKNKLRHELIMLVHSVADHPSSDGGRDKNFVISFCVFGHSFILLSRRSILFVDN